MKRTLRLRAAALILCLSLLLSGCTVQLTLSEEDDPADAASVTSSEETTTAEAALPTVWAPGAKARLAALPVATPDMTEAERRQLCVDFERMQCSFQWTPTHTFRVEYTNGVNEFKEGVVYGGVPYAHTSSSLYAMLDIYDEETGALLTEPFVKGQGFTTFYGNDCADSVFWAWARVSSTIHYVLTTGMDPNHGCLKLGEYEYDATQGYFGQTTPAICQANGEEVMYRSYAACKMADGIVVNDQSKGGSAGHTRMVSEDAHVEYREDGTIDPDRSYLVCIEQKSSFSPTAQDGHIVQAQGGVDREFSFRSLFSSGYIPFQIGEVAGILPVQTAQAHLEGEISVEKLIDLEIVSNYRIDKVYAVVTDGTGAVLLDRSAYGAETWMYRMPLVSVFGGRAALERLGAGEYRMRITARVGSGETLTAYDGPITVPET